MNNTVTRWALALLMLAGLSTPALGVSRVKIKFSPKAKRNITQADMDAIVARVQQKLQQFTNVVIVTTGPAEYTLEAQWPADTEKWGAAWKQYKFAKILIHNNTYTSARRAIFDTDDKKRNQWGETAAHEIAHLLWAPHNSLSSRNTEAKAAAECRKPLAQRQEQPTLMTEGWQVCDDERAADNRGFTAGEKQTIAAGIAAKKGGQTTTTDSYYRDCCTVTTVRGTVNTSPDELIKEDDTVWFNATVSDPTWAIGFMTVAGDFIPVVDAGLGEGVIGFDQASFVQFAIGRGPEVLAFDRNRGDLALGGELRQPTDADELGLDQPYFGQLQLLIDPAGANVSVFLDTLPFGETDGFALDPLLWKPWLETFENNLPGQGVHGYDNWSGWNGDPTRDGLVSTLQQYDGSQSLMALDSTDVVRTFSNITSGQWTLRILTYVPADMLGRQYCNVLTEYAEGGPYHWTAQVWFDAAAGVVGNGEGGMAATGGVASVVPLIPDDWVELRFVFDLDADTKSIYYDDMLLASQSWTCEGCFGQPKGALNLAAVELASSGAIGMHFDLFSLTTATVASIPALSGWALFILALLVLSAGTIVVTRRRMARA